jgi:hypothetical protein
LARLPDVGLSRNGDPLALGRMASVLAVQGTTRSRAHSRGASPVDPAHGERKSNVGQERIANELLLKLGLRVSPRTVRKYMDRGPRPTRLEIAAPKSEDEHHLRTPDRNHPLRVSQCLDWIIPMSEDHLRKILKSWSKHYNQGRPHLSLGPRIPDPPIASMASVLQNTRHRLAFPCG